MGVMWSRVMRLVAGAILVIGFGAAAANASGDVAWSVSPLPPVSDGGLWGVSCSSITFCMAVGYQVGPLGHHVPLAYRFDGVSWSLQSTPYPPGGLGSDIELNAVSCTSSIACTAVGYADLPVQLPDGLFQPQIHALAEHWDGVEWSIQATPGVGNVNGQNLAELTGVSCTSSTACTAVGISNFAGGGATLVERWDGVQWSIQPSPSPGSDGAGLNTVSCASGTTCTAVGHSVPYGPTLVERWDGARWTTQTTHDAPNWIDPNLHGVSCTSNAACVAVGAYTIDVADELVGKVLAEHWVGLQWSVQPVAMPSDANRTVGVEHGSMTAVSCVARAACTAVGWYRNKHGSGVQVALAEHWDGHAWFPEPAAHPPGTYQFLSAVSCVTDTACVAVGQSGSPAGVAPLAERSIGLAPARVAITGIRATPLSLGCATETGVQDRESRAVAADAVCRHFQLTVGGTIRVGGRLARTARGRLTVAVTATLPRGPTMRAARRFVAGGRWHILLVLPGVNLDPLPPLYLIVVRYHGDHTIGQASAMHRIRVESELAGL